VIEAASKTFPRLNAEDVVDPKAAPGDLVRALASLLLAIAGREVAEQHKQKNLAGKK
jgi:hypothetical protein